MHPTTLGALRRLTLATALGTAGALAVTAPADAGAPTRVDAEYWSVSCVAALPGGETIFLFGGGTTDGAEGGVGAFIEAADGSQVAEGQTSSFEFGSTFATSIGLGAETFAISAGVDRGPTVTEQVDERDGNAWTRGTTSTSELTITPSGASYGGQAVELDPGACNGDINAFDVRTTNPSASIHRDGDFESEICDVVGLEDAQVRVTGVLPNAYVEVVLDHGGEDVEKAQGELVLRGGRGTLRTDVVDLFTGDVRTTATIGLVLERSGKTVRQVVAEDGSTQRQSVTPYRETITVALADGRRGTATCSGVAVKTETRTTPAG
jgi:hypothetical protein